MKETEDKTERPGSLPVLVTGDREAVASLGLVSPGAASDGCRPMFSWNIWRPFISHRLWKVNDLFLAVVSSPLPPSHVVYPVFFLNSATKKLVGCHPLKGITRGGPLPSQWRHCREAGYRTGTTVSQTARRPEKCNVKGSRRFSVPPSEIDVPSS